MGGVIPRAEDFENSNTVFSIGNEGEGAGGDHADFYVVNVIELAVRGEELIEFGRGGIFHVDDGEALFAGGDVSVGTGDVDVAGVFERDFRSGDKFGLGEIGNVENF